MTSNNPKVLQSQAMSSIPRSAQCKIRKKEKSILKPIKIQLRLDPEKCKVQLLDG